MNTEHVMSGLAALRDTIALPDLFGMVVESLGGPEALAASLGEEFVAELEGRAYEAAGGERTGADLDAMRDADVARLENIQGMAECFCTWLHAKGAAQMQREDDDAVDKIRQLSGSFSKAARAARLTMVLKHEVAGLRPLPQSRAGGAGNQGAAANQNGPDAPAAGSAGNSSANKRRGETREEKERREKEEMAGDGRQSEGCGGRDGPLSAGPARRLRQGCRRGPAGNPGRGQARIPGVILTTIAASIPHPNLDRRMADIHLGQLWDSVSPHHAIKPESLAPPNWDSVRRERWNDERHRTARAERAARRRR